MDPLSLAGLAAQPPADDPHSGSLVPGENFFVVGGSLSVAPSFTSVGAAVDGPGTCLGRRIPSQPHLGLVRGGQSLSTLECDSHQILLALSLRLGLPGPPLSGIRLPAAGRGGPERYGCSPPKARARPAQGCGQGETPRPAADLFIWRVTHTRLAVN